MLEYASYNYLLNIEHYDGISWFQFYFSIMYDRLVNWM